MGLLLPPEAGFAACPFLGQGHGCFGEVLVQMSPLPWTRSWLFQGRPGADVTLMHSTAGYGQDPDVPCTGDHSQHVPRQARRERGCWLHR